ncbi:unnamed protein product [Trichogramma brassicae]|uniref:Uncharacterized protein n=1 Tax=Trichogramma brassicae TaxID=86971 RepID=A0A6H5HWK9_9HYME|nr:unnamed protein product [Trichogramma brassicae]
MKSSRQNRVAIDNLYFPFRTYKVLHTWQIESKSRVTEQIDATDKHCATLRYMRIFSAASHKDSSQHTTERNLARRAGQAKRPTTSTRNRGQLLAGAAASRQTFRWMSSRDREYGMYAELLGNGVATVETVATAATAARDCVEISNVRYARHIVSELASIPLRTGRRASPTFLIEYMYGPWWTCVCDSSSLPCLPPSSLENSRFRAGLV